MVISLFAVEHGFLDDIDLKKIVAFERELQAYFKTNYTDVFNLINEKPEYNDEIAAKLQEVLTVFKQTQTW
jgi:F-type H+-transporting ATPase subunit alpha